MSGDAVDKLAVYIHWPYCARICPYCDFNVYKRREDNVLLPAILSDLQYWRNMSGPREISSIHFGGGTPSLMTPVQVGAVIETVGELWGTGDIEIALEANPHEMNAENWRAYATAGLNRLSLGVQSFDDEALKFLGRDHDGDTARSALNLAMKLFPSVSADLIFGWAGQSEVDLAADISTLLAAEIPHISTYQLTIEDGTAFAKAEGRGQRRTVSDNLSASFYDLVRQALGEAGFQHYEVSNFAKPGHRSRHNLAYWQGLDYVGVGPGAHGRITLAGKRHATITHLSPKTYTQMVETSGTGIESREPLLASDAAAEYVLMGLRIDDGISLSRFEKISGQELDPAELRYLIKDGFVQRNGDKICATAQGRLVLNTVTERLLLS